MAAPIEVGAVLTVKELNALLQDVGTKVQNLRPVFVRIDRDIDRELREQFATRGAHFGTPWAPLSPATPEVRIRRRMVSERARAKARSNAGADTPLIDTGAMYASFTKPGAPFSLRVIDALSYRRGSSYSVDGVPVAALMQEGFLSTMKPVWGKTGEVRFIKRAAPKQVPARPIIPENFPAPVMKAWEGYITQYLENGTLA